MNVTDKTNNHSSDGTTYRKSKFLRKEKHDSNPERMNHKDSKSVIAFESTILVSIALTPTFRHSRTIYLLHQRNL